MQKALLIGDPPYTDSHLLAMGSEDEGAVFPLRDRSEESLAVPDSLLTPAVLRSALAGNEEVLVGLRRLPYTRTEVERVASLIPETTILLGSQATEQELVRLAESGELRSFDTIHLATHALIDDEICFGTAGRTK